MKKRILGLDPGLTNFGIALTELDLETCQVRVVRNSMLRNPVRDLKGGLRAQQRRFFKEINYWVERGRVDGIVAERFQARGLRGNTGECVTFMLGLLSAQIQKPLKLVTAATWKNPLNRRLRETEFEDLKQLYKWTKVQPHQLDATFISIYGYEQGTGICPQYDLQELVLEIEERSATRLIRRRNR